jgi:hypothetical protein
MPGIHCIAAQEGQSCMEVVRMRNWLNHMDRYREGSQVADKEVESNTGQWE